MIFFSILSITPYSRRAIEKPFLLLRVPSGRFCFCCTSLGAVCEQREAQSLVCRGWQQLDVQTGWVHILRGLCPKAEKWPVASVKVQRRQILEEGDGDELHNQEEFPDPLGVTV